jgi:hypothetical protein
MVQLLIERGASVTMSDKVRCAACCCRADR